MTIEAQAVIKRNVTNVLQADGTYVEERYETKVVKQFMIATVFWAIVAFLAGDFIAWQMVFPQLNFDSEYLSFGRLRPVHTSAAIFAFGGSGLIGISLYCVQRTSDARLFGGEKMGSFIFWGYQTFIVLAAASYVFGFSQSKEYAEPEWYIDIFLAIVWITYAVAFIGTIVKRKIKHIYVANWFFLSFIITTALLHVVNNISIPVVGDLAKSYSVFAGVQDAMVQWWYGHNAVGFFLTAGFLGIMYYVIPKQAERPIYSYRLSIVHFWGLVFLYIWAGPHHLIGTSLPEWTQTLGTLMSLILWIPSWGGMVNGIMTVSGRWNKLTTDPILRFLVTSVAFYGMSTFEGPMMSIKALNSLSHYTEWTVAHVHSGALGWNALILFGAIYFMIPRVFNKEKMYSKKLIEIHYWIAMIGIVLYIFSMWAAGITQGLMWRSTTELGFLEHSFLESLLAIKPYLLIRAIGGLVFVIGGLIMVYNVYKTITLGKDKV